MEHLEMTFYISAIITSLGVVIGGIGFYYASTKSKTVKAALESQQATITAQTERIDLLQTQIECGEKASQEHQVTINSLVSKVDVLSTIPLEKIEKHMSDTNKILQSIIPLVSQVTNTHTVTDTKVTNK